MNDKREPMKATLLSLSDEDRASNMLMDCADFFAATLAKADPKAWKHLLIYAPKSTPSERDRDEAAETERDALRTELGQLRADFFATQDGALVQDLRGVVERVTEERDALREALEAQENHVNYCDVDAWRKLSKEIETERDEWKLIAHRWTESCKVAETERDALRERVKELEQRINNAVGDRDLDKSYDAGYTAAMKLYAGD